MLWQMLSLIKSPILLAMFIILMIVPLLFSIAFHELAHGWTAYKFGDPTAKMMGRLTLNPFHHLDPIGTLCLLVIGLGWAKPVIVNYRNIPNPNHQMLVAAAGPASNFLLALIFTLIISMLENFFHLPFNHLVITFLNIIIMINLGLALFNLIPIPPLDGSKIIMWILPEQLKYQYSKIEPYGMFIFMLLLVTVGFNWIFYGAAIIKSYLFTLLQVTL